ncbi:MAG: protoheme IX farnesyltransferase [Cytophagales bacterium]|nr:MAG: protoheme IX farnesyltransferase [Cytophagales bacterium]
MLSKNIEIHHHKLSFTNKLKAYFELLKFRLSFLVVFSAGIGYMLGVKSSISLIPFVLFLIGGFLITGAANTVNQIIEINLDKLMKRTQNRPLPTGRISVQEATIFSTIIFFIGLYLLIVHVNLYSAILTTISAVIYAFIYTPLKQVSSIAVLVGAIPGALPPLIGWVACTDSITVEGLLLFLIQFIWQFPHFWAIAWVLDDDYKKANFKLLPFGGVKDINTALQIMIYTLMLIPLGLIPTKLGMTGINFGIIATVTGVIFLMQTFYLMKECTNKAAKLIMFGSFLYLPIVQIAFVWDKL